MDGVCERSYLSMKHGPKKLMKYRRANCLCVGEGGKVEQLGMEASHI